MLRIMGKELIYSEEKGEIVLYQPNENLRLEVMLQDETVWLTQQQMTELFKTSAFTSITFLKKENWQVIQLSRNP